MEQNVFLILHGWGGNKPNHWQEHLVRQLQEAGKRVYYPAMPDPSEPDLGAWLNRLRGEVEQIRSDIGIAPITVLAHSLGSVTWMHFASAYTGSSPVGEQVLLVAPPYVIPQIPPADVPSSVTAFYPPPMSPDGIRRAGRETILIASDTDDYATYDQSVGYAQRLEIPIYKLAGAGHISPYYGYGEWPWVIDWCLGRAALPPAPRPA